MQAQLGDSGGTLDSATDVDDTETLCAVCFDARKDHIIVPCGHQCLCGACAKMLVESETRPKCPLCRGDIRETMKVFT